MSRAASVLPSAIAVLAASLSALTITLAVTPASAATDCSAAPKSPAPQGSHWYYRTDRASNRKCWYLGPEGQRAKVQKETQRAAAPAQPAEQAAPPSPPGVAEPPASPAEPEPAQATAVPAAAAVQEPVPVRTFTVPAGASDLAAGSAGAQDDATPAQNAAPVEAPVQQPVAVAGNVSAPAVEPIGPFRLATGALVALGLLASGIFYLVSHRRRRSRAYEQIVDLNVRTPLRTPPKIDDPKPSAPARAVRRRDQAEVDMERLREFSQAWKQRAA